MAEANKGGRPRLYDDPIFFEEKVEAYFDECTAKERPPVIAGLCYFLGFHDKQALDNYQDYDGFSLTVKKARLRIEAAKNEMLFDRKFATAGVIFDLKNNHGWSDRMEVNDITPRDYANEVTRAKRAAMSATVPEEEEDDAEVV